MARGAWQEASWGEPCTHCEPHPGRSLRPLPLEAACSQALTSRCTWLQGADCSEMGPGEARTSLGGELSAVTTPTSTPGAAPALCPVTGRILTGNGCFSGPGAVTPTSHPCSASTHYVDTRLSRRGRRQDTQRPECGESVCTPAPRSQPSPHHPAPPGLPRAPSPGPGDTLLRCTGHPRCGTWCSHWAGGCGDQPGRVHVALALLPGEEQDPGEKLGGCRAEARARCCRD